MHLGANFNMDILKLSNSEPGCSISALCFCVKKTPPLALWHQDISDTYIFCFYYSRVNACPRAGKRVGIGDCHASRAHQKTIIFTSIVYAFDNADILN
jgi:hypothetical protein